MLRPFPLLLLAATVCVYLSVTSAVDKSKFRTCKDTGFCRRYRKHVPHSHYHIDRASIVKGTDSIQATLKGGPAEAVPLPLTVSFYDTGVARVRITDPAKERWQPPEVVLTDDLKSTKYSVVKEDGNSLVA